MTTTTTAGALRRAVDAWLESLDDAQRATAMFPFGSGERRAWEYRPVPRAGLAIGAMTPAQRAAAWVTVDAAMSIRAAAEARAIVALEPILGAIERAAGDVHAPVRDPERFWFAVFGEPGDPSGWSWRVGGHHLAVHVTVVDGIAVSGAPSFLGANPAVVPSGPTRGARAITGEETLARALIRVMTPGERDRAVVDAVAPPDIRSGVGARADLRGVPAGIAHGDLGAEARAGLESLIRHYLDRAPDDVAARAWETAVGPDLDATTFAWAGGVDPGQGHYYAVRGARLLIEYDNTQDGANHIHSVWRDLVDDWGEDTLAAHYRAAHA